ncbi:response regulator [Oceanobacillus sp. J11TS1]|uniref:response regulator n=1 Tax=Oceanobacillus sp. J11TS1 TaxID=2807191 RepID=UPI001B0946BE|nr:response regulator [Oceanobacillus sp. J11TS1]GIO24900.1 hypothetical protein J11TS1_34810 [Oceanobacillus sp. J11TS1]
MLRICIVDDENLALQYLDSLLNKMDDVQVIGKFNDPQNIIDYVRRQNVDIVFLDIHMPTMKGIDVAERLLNIQPSLHIVFVTGYNEYAVKAFELNALDYILKPVQKDRLQLTINRIREKSNIRKSLDSPQSTYTIKNLGDLSIYMGEILVDVKWRTAKAKELFAYLIQNHRNAIRKSELTSLLWDNLPWEKAHSQLYSTIYQIRKVIQQTGIQIKIVSEDEFYHINMNNVKIQSDEWRQSALRLLEMDHVSIRSYLELLEEYQGHYLEKMPYSWSLEERKDLRVLWLQIIEILIEYIKNNKDVSLYALPKINSLAKLDDEAAMLVQI